ncbi:hypothetical protein HD554DRAFT_311812 [Boletus coccyginus]|nr:hypothetical protein HD554DRAFT_311812 [Boletus coccyginus]
MPHLAIVSFAVTSSYAVLERPNNIMDALQYSATSLWAYCIGPVLTWKRGTATKARGAALRQHGALSHCSCENKCLHVGDKCLSEQSLATMRRWAHFDTSQKCHSPTS